MARFDKVTQWLRANGLKMGVELGVNFALPVLIYDWSQPHLGDTRALLASSVPPLLWSGMEFARSRRIDALSLIVIAGIILSLLAFIGGGSARMLQLREALVTAVIGMAFLISAAIRRPLIYPLAIATMRRQSAEAANAFAARRGEASVHRTVMIMTWVWGLGLCASAALCSALVFLLSIGDYLIVSPIIGYGTMAGLSFWTFRYRQSRVRKAAQAQADGDAARLNG